MLNWVSTLRSSVVEGQERAWGNEIERDTRYDRYVEVGEMKQVSFKKASGIIQVRESASYPMYHGNLL